MSGVKNFILSVHMLPLKQKIICSNVYFFHPSPVLRAIKKKKKKIAVRKMAHVLAYLSK